MLRVATRTSPAPATLLARLNLPWRGRVDALLDTLHKVQPGLDRLRRSFDDHIVGHSDIKEAFLLALLAREHLYIEGPPGVAKTMLSEIVSKATDLRPFIYQCHRDTRLNELVGESVIVRSTDAGGRETIRQDVVPGGVLACELAVLDDISRAPGEALNVLLRVLNERRWGGGPKLPLQTAIATGNPVADDGFYGDPLDPATLDRFTLQLRAQGLVQSADWAGCAEVIDLYSGPRDVDHEPHVARCGPSLLRDASALVPMVVFPPACKRVLLRLLVLLAVGVMKARAVLRGRHVCDPSDLRVVRYLTAFRVPEPLHLKIDESEPAEAALWCEAPSPRLPRRTRRHSPGAAGRVAIVRDTSSSMEGLWHRWAGLVCTSVVDLAKQHRMPVGYCEFSSSARKFLPADSRAHQRRRFFSREYAALAAHSGEAQSGGTTNFEAPLRTILEEEIEEARGLGVAVHTIFIGNSRCPPVLDRLSEETGGTSWAAYFDVQSRSIRLVDRQAGEAAGLEASSPRPEQQKLDRLARVPALFNKYVEEKYGDAL
ncbi:hypothetical protein EMIHUDRAFT_450255 [Emiliania huxleyi CCMP1516]|uniref:MoxR domain-containing protein n=2 Tax=Emiliania huxleyi TaxID=2903 RepID=A0A0D3JS86_EMIH1|nr:hypothetical protein EMIHUDRAFT_450255 [Emiliania huxleyi CCMP1516]EOD26371.1 hypothetical protein EMIHUDRAFT_450255 [Emiliania huxleyi CCMP1516]|eukprot:XP_005778800.1 hypothetical protein EMIHUDRAFT_450255 [Emiliania huxleyi CCMP1516]